MAGADILHVDLDAFYASVEQLLNPALRGRPVAVGGGVVLAASYEAKAFGVQSGMAGGKARRLCPGLVFVGGSFAEYVRLSDQVFAICTDMTPHVERISIDEAFLDVSGSRHLFGPPGTIAALIRRRVADEVGLPISAGAARTKFLAKVASQVAKPDGLVVVDPEHELDFLHPLPVRLMWGVGPVIGAHLASLGVETIGDLAAMPGRTLETRLGKGAGRHLHALAWNRDPRSVKPLGRSGSVGAQSALGRSGSNPAVRDESLLHLADRIGSRLRKKHRAGRTVSVRVRFDDMKSITRSHTLGHPVDSTAAIHRVATLLLADGLSAAAGREITLVGISVSNLLTDPDIQLELPFDGGDIRRPGSLDGDLRRRLDEQVDSVRERFGKESVGSASVVLSTRRSVPDAFREIVEKNS
ncbi:MAG: DNA polymerase IV [Acidimicrobiia bacterium]|nr:DNA polymerase IV [Acidimicrobiia bacterium]